MKNALFSRAKYVWTLLLLFSMQILVGAANQDHSSKSALQFIGTVIAYDAESQSDLLRAHIEALTMLVRIDRLIDGEEHAKYIWVTYEYVPQEDSAPPNELFTGSAQWRFAVLRDAGRDGTIKDTYIQVIDQTGKYLTPRPRFKRVPGAENEPIPKEDEALNAYKLRSGDLSKLPKDK